MTDKIVKTEAEWRDILTAEQYHVTREHGTERAFTGALDKHYEDGTYHCICCGEALFSSDTKFNSGSGWPSFFDKLDSDSVGETEDNSFFMRRDRGALQPVRGASRACVSRWAGTDRASLLHQFGVTQFRGAGGLTGPCS